MTLKFDPKAKAQFLDILHKTTTATQADNMSAALQACEISGDNIIQQDELEIFKSAFEACCLEKRVEDPSSITSFGSSWSFDDLIDIVDDNIRHKEIVKEYEDADVTSETKNGWDPTER
jgi:hypothetical protein